jgi:hypothetical protein
MQSIIDKWNFTIDGVSIDGIFNCHNHSLLQPAPRTMQTYCLKHRCFALLIAICSLMNVKCQK